MGYKIWIDDLRQMPADYDIHVKSVNTARAIIGSLPLPSIELIDLDHDAGDYFKDGGDYIKVLDWLEVLQAHGYDLSTIQFRFHTGNPSGLVKMEQIAAKNKWHVIDDEYDIIEEESNEKDRV